MFALEKLDILKNQESLCGCLLLPFKVVNQWSTSHDDNIPE